MPSSLHYFENFRDHGRVTPVTFGDPSECIPCRKRETTVASTLGDEMDRRRETRVDAAFLVRVWGVDKHARPFIQVATARNISSLGVVLQGMRSQVKPGEVLDLQYDGQRAQFRVVWLGRPCSCEEGEMGLERLPEEPFIWDIDPVRCAQVVANG